MKLSIEPYEQHHVDAVRALNQRLQAAESEHRFPESPVPTWLPPRDGVPVHQEYFVMCDGERVCGAYVLKPQEFSVRGVMTQIADFRLPISEGIVDQHYSMVGFLALKDAMRRQPLLFGLGMGSRQAPIARMLRIVKWGMIDCDFFFKVIHPTRFLRKIVALRRTRSRRMLLNLLAWSRGGWLALRGAQRLRSARAPRVSGFEIQILPEFDAEVDRIWDQSHRTYSLIALRNRVVLNSLYPTTDPRFIRLGVSHGGERVGWVVLLDTEMRGHKQFGDLRVGSIVDCLAVPGYEARAIRLATEYIAARGVDLIVSNQLHEDWCSSFRLNGYLRGPSNFIFAAAPSLCAKLEPFQENARRIHMTRGDGDGPINL